jgi:hypothetical protein
MIKPKERHFKNDESDVVRELNYHICKYHNSSNALQAQDIKKYNHFVRNFKIFFLKGDNHLF